MQFIIVAPPLAPMCTYMSISILNNSPYFPPLTPKKRVCALTWTLLLRTPFSKILQSLQRNCWQIPQRRVCLNPSYSHPVSR